MDYHHSLGLFPCPEVRFLRLAVRFLRLAVLCLCVVAPCLALSAHEAGASNPSSMDPVTKKKQSRLIQEWNTLDSKLHALSVRETELTNQKLQIETSLAETNENIKILSEIIQKKRQMILNRIRYLNREVGGDIIRNLMDSHNPGELDRHHRFILQTTQFDLQNIRQYLHDVATFESELQRQRLRIAQINDLQRSVLTESKSFLSELKRKSALLDEIRGRLKSDAKVWQEKLEQARREGSEKKVSFYQSLLKQNFLDRKGQLTSPTDAPVRQAFGLLKLDERSPSVPFQGVLFSSSPGSPVRAMAEGKLAWYGTLPQLGPTVVLDHGRGLSSLYARVHLANLTIGHMIKEGFELGRVSSEAGALGQGLYFEVREGLWPADPLRWILTNSELFNKEQILWENVQ